MRTPEAQSGHDRMVKAMADKFERDGMRVRADHIGHKNGMPASINGHIPDVEATSVNKRIILEAETPDAISSENTKKQMRAFSTVSDAEFHVIVQNGYTEVMQKQAMEWGIRIDKIWIMEV